MRRLRSRWYRVMHPRVRFGKGCDVRDGFRCVQTSGSWVSFGSGCILDRSLTIEANGRLRVGERVIFGHHVTIGVQESIEIGDTTMIGELVSIRDHDHAIDRTDRPMRDQGVQSAAVSIGRDVWIGGKATVLRGVRIGDHAVVGANAVVTKDVAAYAVVVGVPARVVRMRDAEPVGLKQTEVPATPEDDRPRLA